MHIHSLKHNAKAAAKRIAARFSGLEVVDPVKAMPQPGTGPDGWYASLKVADGVLPTSIAPEVLEQAHLEVPEGWMVYNGNSIQRVEDVRGVETAVAEQLMEALLPLVGKPNDEATRDEAAGIIENVMLDQLLSGVKPGSKEAQVFAMLRKPEGATVAAIAAVMDWEPHTTRAYISVRTRKRGVVAITEKVEGRGRVYRLALPEASTAAA